MKIKTLLGCSLFAALVFTACSSDSGTSSSTDSSSSVESAQSSSLSELNSSSSKIVNSSSSIDFGSLVDSRDGKEYRTTQIGTQIWMAENLNYETASGSWCYDNNPDNCAIYGRLYNWSTAMNNASSSNANPSGVQGVCPAGWHLPSRLEWNDLEDYAGGSSVAGAKLKAVNGWNSGGNGGTDDYGFSALPGGSYSSATFDKIGDYGYWWLATLDYYTSVFLRYINYSLDGVYSASDYKTLGHSVRCVKD